MTNQEVIAILGELKKCYLGGIVDALDFAIESVKAQEPRVMTLEEVLKSEDEDEPILYEYIDSLVITWRMGWKLRTESKREIQHILENRRERAIVWESEYGKTWRCWTSRPDQATREVTPWN